MAGLKWMIDDWDWTFASLTQTYFTGSSNSSVRFVNDFYRSSYSVAARSSFSLLSLCRFCKKSHIFVKIGCKFAILPLRFSRLGWRPLYTLLKLCRYGISLQRWRKLEENSQSAIALDRLITQNSSRRSPPIPSLVSPYFQYRSTGGAVYNRNRYQ